MCRPAFLLACLGGLALSAAADAAAPPAARSVGKTIRPFRLDDVHGKPHSSADWKGDRAVVILVLGTECPLNNAFMPTVVALHREYTPKGVRFVAINSNAHDTPAKILAHARAHGLPFPVLKDTANALADELGARRTPEAFVLSPAGTVLYQGRIDDQFGIGFRRKQPTRRDLAVALDEVLAGKPVSTPVTEAPGCLIARAITPRQDGTITFTRHVSRILQNRCQECHRAGEVGPMPLVTYKDAVAWSEMIREVVSEGRMPPWSADPRHGEFANDRHLPAAERETLLGWIRQGCARGDEKDLPPEKAWPGGGWLIGKPDVVFEMPREFTVPKDAGPRGVPYKYFVIPTNFGEDRWLQAAEARPGAREVVHHILVYVVPKSRLGKKGPRDPDALPADGLGNGLLVAYAPGDLPIKLPPGYAKKLPKDSALVLQMHYTPDGVERKDRSQVALKFADGPPQYEVRTRAITQQFFLIPPGSQAHEVKSQTRFDRDVELISMLPHMHLRGKDFQYVATFPGGKKQTLLSVPRYDFNWQTNYLLRKPLRLPAGTRIDCTAHFDNSAANPNNPDPKKWVHWGEQTWEEMMIGFVDYAVARKTGEAGGPKD